MSTSSRWLNFWTEQEQPEGGLRLFCFHHAGGGASGFRPWTKRLSNGIEVVAVQLPGREDRLDEPLLQEMDLVTAPLADALSPLLDRPFAFFGHSTGAVICFELARVLRQRGLPQPRLLIVSGQNAPGLKPAAPRHQLSDPEFIEVLRDCDGTPDVVLGNPELLELLLPRIRADGAIFETYPYEQQSPLDCRIVALHGLEDDLVSSAGLEGWKAETRESFHCYGFPGGHFFLQDMEERVIDLINHELEPFLRECQSS